MMSSYLRSIDLKVLGLCLLGCYFLPELLLGTFFAALASASGAWIPWVIFPLLGGFLLGPPVAAGYFTARYARVLPQFHVLFVVLAGSLAVAATTLQSQAFALRAAYVPASLVLVALGAVTWERQMRRDGVPKKEP